jgi:hypothetical protein
MTRRTERVLALIAALILGLVASGWLFSIALGVLHGRAS